MALFTTDDITISEEQKLPTRTYKFDVETGRIRGHTDGLEAVEQSIWKALQTARFKNLIYNSDYGSEIEKCIFDKDVNEEYIKTEIPRLVEDALSVDERVLSVYDFDFSFETDSCKITFKANTVYGETTIEQEVS